MSKSLKSDKDDDIDKRRRRKRVLLNDDTSTANTTTTTTTNTNTINGEKSFWKIWRNRYLRNIIFKCIDDNLIFKNRDDLYLGNRIKFENMVSIDMMITKNAISILLDKIKSNQPLDITNLSISKLYQSADKYQEILELLYKNYKIQMDSIRINLCGAPIESLKLYNKLHQNNGGVIGFTNYQGGGVIDIIQDKEIVDNAIQSMNFKVLEFVKYIHNIVLSSNSNTSNNTSNQPIPINGYSENLLIQNACKSNDPERMLKYIEDELQLNLESLVKKYSNINHYNILMNVLDKLPSERISLVHYSANEGCTYDKPFHYVFPFKYNVENLKCLVLDTVPKKNDLLSKKFTIEELLEKYKSGYEHKYFPFFIDYFFKLNQVDRIINYLKISRSISIIGDQYKTLYNDMQIFFYVETIRNFNLKALEYVIESNISLHFLNKESVIEPLSNIIQTDQVVQFLKRFTSFYDVHCYIVKLLFIYYPIETIESLLENVIDFKIKFQKELNSERSDTFCFLISKLLNNNNNTNASTTFQKINLLLKFRIKKIDDIKIRKAIPTTSTATVQSNEAIPATPTTIILLSNNEKVLIFNQLCNNDINQIISNQCKRKLFIDLNIKANSFQEAIELYKLINFQTIQNDEKSKIQCFLFREFILEFFENNNLNSINLIYNLFNNNNNNTSTKSNNIKTTTIITRATTTTNTTNTTSINIKNIEKFEILEKIINLNNHYILKKFTKSLIVNDYQLNESINYLVSNIIGLQYKLPYSILYSLLDKTRYQVIKFLFLNYKDHIVNSCSNRIGLVIDEENDGEGNGDKEEEEEEEENGNNHNISSNIIDQLFINFKYQYYFNVDKMVTSNDTLDKSQALFLHFGSPNHFVDYFKNNHKQGTPLILLDQTINNRIFEFTNLDQFLELSKHLSFKNQLPITTTTTTTTTTTNNNTAATATTTTTLNSLNIDEDDELFENNQNNLDIAFDENDENNMDIDNESNSSGSIISGTGSIVIDDSINLGDNQSELISILNNSIIFNRLDIISHYLTSKLITPYIIINSLITKDKLFIIEYLIKTFKNQFFLNPIDKKLNLVYLSLLYSSNIACFRLIVSLYPEFDGKFIVGRSIVNLLVQNDNNNDKLHYLFQHGLLTNLEYLKNKCKKVNGILTKMVFPPQISKTIDSIIQSQSKREYDSTLNLDKRKLKKKFKI